MLAKEIIELLSAYPPDAEVLVCDAADGRFAPVLRDGVNNVAGTPQVLIERVDMGLSEPMEKKDANALINNGFGLGLRDTLAAFALAGALGHDYLLPEEAAKAAYRHADAMLAQRNPNRGCPNY